MLSVGEGRANDAAGKLLIPERMRAQGQGLVQLIQDVFGDLETMPAAELEQLLKRGRAILSPRNDEVAQVNEEAVGRLRVEANTPHSQRTYLSSDWVDESDENAHLYSPDFLNSLNPQGAAPHKLTLKVGAPIMLLRNLNVALGLANGTRLIVRSCRTNFITAEVTTGSEQHIGKLVLIPRINITPSDSNLPIDFTRRQFPVKLAFAMTINKSQGQTFEKVGIYLPRPCFSHGQLYVACSRVGSATGVTIMVVPGAHLPARDKLRATQTTWCSLRFLTDGCTHVVLVDCMLQHACSHM